MAKDKDLEEQKDPARPAGGPQPPELDQTSDKAEEGLEKTGGRRTLLHGKPLQWIIIAAVPAICAGAGFGLGRLLGHWTATETTDSAGGAAPTQAQLSSHGTPSLTRADGAQKNVQKGWYFDLEPVVANLNEPGATRYVRVALTLEISPELDERKATAFLQQNTPLLKNWLTIYLAGKTIEDMRGDRNLQRLQLEILDTFNEKLFPDATPQIKRVLIKEFAIQ